MGSRNYNPDDERSTKALTNITTTLKNIYTANDYAQFDSLIEMSNLLPEESIVLKGLIQIILEIAFKNTDIFIRKNEKISNLLNRYICNSKNKDQVLDLMIIFTKILDKLHDFSYSVKLNTKLVTRQIFSYINSENGSPSKELNMFYFYTIGETVSYMDLKSFLVSKIPELEREYSLTRQIMDGVNGDFSKFDVDYFNKTYGGDFG
jgi:hypothetical protein